MIDAIRQILKYANFFKEFWINKKKHNGYEKVLMGQNVSVVLQKELPQKREDPEMFVIPCTIGSIEIRKAMCDLGASLNPMPFSLYSCMGWVL